MAKRQLGLGKVQKNKKQKSSETVVEESNVPETGNLTVELPANADDDEFTQVKSLFEKFTQDKNELMLNGVIHECDRLIRNESESKIPEFFYKIYSDALLEMIEFNDNEKEISDLIDLSLEKIDLGLERFQKDALLQLQKSKVLLNQIAFNLGKLKEELDTKYKFEKVLKLALHYYEDASKTLQSNKHYDHFNEDTFKVLTLVDDILEVVDNFGKSDDDDEEEEVQGDVPDVIEKIRDDDYYNQWWRAQVIEFYDVLKKNNNKPESLFKTVSFNLGQSYLREAEEPTTVFTTLMYEEEDADESELKRAQKIGIKLLETAINYLRDSWDDDNVESWVNLSESLISLGNLYDLDSKQQLNCYKEAEDILIKANNVTNGKYKDILENLLDETD